MSKMIAKFNDHPNCLSDEGPLELSIDGEDILEKYPVCSVKIELSGNKRTQCFIELDLSRYELEFDGDLRLDGVKLPFDMSNALLNAIQRGEYTIPPKVIGEDE